MPTVEPNVMKQPPPPLSAQQRHHSLNVIGVDVGLHQQFNPIVADGQRAQPALQFGHQRLDRLGRTPVHEHDVLAGVPPQRTHRQSPRSAGNISMVNTSHLPSRCAVRGERQCRPHSVAKRLPAHVGQDASHRLACTFRIS